MKKSIIFLLFISLISCNNKITQNLNPQNPEKYAATIQSSELKDMLYTIAGDDFLGRETATEGERLTREYLINNYSQNNIPAAANTDHYNQKVALAKMKEPITTLTVNGSEFNYWDNYINISNSADFNLQTNEIVYAGYGIVDDNYNSYEGVDVKDKVVLIKFGEPRNADGTYVVTGTTTPSKWSGNNAYKQKRDILSSLGAKAVFFYQTKDFANYAKVFKSRLGRLGLLHNEQEKFVLINSELAQGLMPNIENTYETQLISTDLAFNFERVYDTVDAYNVAAIIKGSEFPDEYVVVSAHLDHIGVGDDGDVYNGADDDGSGTVALLEIAEAFKQAADENNAPRRSIIFLHVTGEEYGLFGSRYYTDVDPLYPLENTVANLNVDMIGRVDDNHLNNPNYIYLIGSDKLSQELHNLSESTRQQYSDIEFDYTYNDENDPNRFYYRSDHYNFAKNNIPIIFYFNGTHADYHKPSDTADKINYELLEKRTRIIFHTAWEIANRDNKLKVD